VKGGIINFLPGNKEGLLIDNQQNISAKGQG